MQITPTGNSLSVAVKPFANGGAGDVTEMKGLNSFPQAATQALLGSTLSPT